MTAQEFLEFLQREFPNAEIKEVKNWPPKQSRIDLNFGVFRFHLSKWDDQERINMYVKHGPTTRMTVIPYHEHIRKYIEEETRKQLLRTQQSLSREKP